MLYYVHILIGTGDTIVFDRISSRNCRGSLYFRSSRQIFVPDFAVAECSLFVNLFVEQ